MRQGMCTRGAHPHRPTPGRSPIILSPLPRGRQEPTCNKALLSSPAHHWGDPVAIRVGRTGLCIQTSFSPALSASQVCACWRGCVFCSAPDTKPFKVTSTSAMKIPKRLVRAELWPPLPPNPQCVRLPRWLSRERICLQSRLEPWV